ncbi:hypothetical protein TVAG_311190 [Trichomonas vaginalis G3]|uniref:Spatacsin C-terminal domain-containing protein n=2 Tax=Trichomonas vaginalis (strain ATCC PRA-98 / G3) TaxID=412133 RepID=A2FUQ1_TRIV3|nr:spatacsin family [Trichomonas vaginalis G3]EAX91368.1 hypothetical protein TVAG_311190 [Trichomonas vaginalis G3]KAI5520086.1 spatacsin family [Trichomonas vaginalis G3]|eukprot:XP_001304298.1 hypothetical protein [Trichomonas vaginalis G3]
MTKEIAIFNYPPELGTPSNWKMSLISPKFFGVLDNSNVLKVYSIESKNIVFTLNDISDFCWIESIHFKSQLLCVISQSKLLIYTSEDKLPQIVIFDASTRKAPISMKTNTDIMNKIIEFPLSENATIATSIDANSLLIVNSNQLEKYTLYLDGLYLQGSCSSNNCTKFAFDGANIAGFSQDTVSIWNTALDEFIFYKVECQYLCPLKPGVFGAIKDNQITIIDKKNGIGEKISIPENTHFSTYVQNNQLFNISSNYSICYPRFECPVFANDNKIMIIEDEEHLCRLLDVISQNFALQFLIDYGKQSEHNAELVAVAACQHESKELVDQFTKDLNISLSLSFVQKLTSIIDTEFKRQFAITISTTIIRLIAKCINSGTELSNKFVAPLCTFRSIVQYPKQPPQYKRPSQGIGDSPPISEKELLPFVLDALQRNAITSALPTLAVSFPDFSPFHLFRTIVLQQCWLLVCSGRIQDTTVLIEKLGENPGQHLHEMWRQTTRNKTRAVLHDYLHKQGLLTQKDDENHQILLKITTKYPNTSFKLARKLNNSPAMKALNDPSKLPSWQPIVDLTTDFNENKAMVFPELFNIPEETPVESPKYFLGNIALIESQSPETIKMLTTDGISVERLWILHCEHRVTEMVNMFKKELEKTKPDQKKNLISVKFINTYYSQMNMYEIETLLDILCQNGVFVQKELDDFDLLVVRICKNKFLFDQSWWSNTTTLNFTDFFKSFAVYCAKKNLFMPFEMFIVSHPKAKEIDMSDIDEPLIKFIWDLWVKRDPAAANLSCMQLIAHSKSNDPIELWKHLPSDSLAPLASFVWNRDPEKFKPGSPETEALSQRLKTDYPLLSSLVKGEIPHPPSPQMTPPQSPWRSPIFTSKFDLELHDLLKAHFDYDFSKVFTDYYGKTPGQPPFPHFDHPELITAPSEPPYVHYVKSMLPVSAFQQAIDDGVTEPKFKELCLQCMREALLDRNIRLAALTFIELVDLKFNTDSATDYKLCIAIFDNLQNENNTILFDELSKVFVQHCKTSAKNIQKKLMANEIELFLLSSLLGVRCGLSLDYTPISNFAKKSRPAELLLFIDRASEIGAHYQINEVVKIIRQEMPENPLKDHLLFHLTQSLPTEEGTNNADIPPALVVFRAVRRTDKPQYISLLQESINHSNQLYALLATSIEGSNPMICALVVLLTMTKDFTFDVTQEIEHEKIVSLFMQVISNLLRKSDKVNNVKQSLELFSDKSIVYYLSSFSYSVQNFLFHQADLVLSEINKVIKDQDPETNYQDDLVGNIKIKDIIQVWHPLLDYLAKLCSQKSQVHLFRFLQLLKTTNPSPFLADRVSMSCVIEKFENFRKAIFECDLLGKPEDIVKKFALNHSLQLGQSVAQVLGTSSSNATQEWLKHQYSTATTPAQVLDIHSQIVSSIQDGDELFFVSLFSALLPYAQPTEVYDILKFSRSLFKQENSLTKSIDALLIHLDICHDLSIEVPRVQDVMMPLSETLDLLFPRTDLSKVPKKIQLGIALPVLYGNGALQRFFDSSIDTTIDYCLDNRRVDDARLLCEWRNKSPKSILLLESVQNLISGQKLSEESYQHLSQFGNVDDIEQLLDSISSKMGRRFGLISLHFKACRRLGWPTNDLLKRKTTDFIESELSVTIQQWPIVRNLISFSKLTDEETANSLSKSFTNHVIDQLSSHPKQTQGLLNVKDFSDKFEEFTKLCQNPSSVGDHLFQRAKELQGSQPISVIVNLLLHSSMCTSDIDECAEMLDHILDKLVEEKQLSLIINIVTIFKDPALLPRYFQHLIAQEKLDALPHSTLSKKVGRVIMNCARHVQPFEPQKYFDLTLNYMLYRDHAELRMECGLRLLRGSPDKNKLQEASSHFLLALAYFLHEKCYSLSMECLKKLSLISLQLEVPDMNVLHLDESQVLHLMKTKDFPFALTTAVAYDMDTEVNWAEAIFTQSVQNKGEEFLTAFQYFRPLTSNLCSQVVKMYKESNSDEEMNKRMKSFLKNIPNLVERYRIAKELQFQDQLDNMKEQNPVVCEWCERVLIDGK